MTLVKAYKSVKKTKQMNMMYLMQHFIGKTVCNKIQTTSIAEIEIE